MQVGNQIESNKREYVDEAGSPALLFLFCHSFYANDSIIGYSIYFFLRLSA